MTRGKNGEWKESERPQNNEIRFRIRTYIKMFNHIYEKQGTLYKTNIIDVRHVNLLLRVWTYWLLFIEGLETRIVSLPKDVKFLHDWR